VLETFHAGSLPQTNSFLAIESGTVALGALKRAEDGDATILSIYETDRTATTARIILPTWNRTFGADFTPCEFKTFLIPNEPQGPVCEVGLLEQSQPSHS